MYFFLILMVVSVVVMAVIVVRKFPQISNVDVDNLPQEKEARKKKEIMTRRVQVEGSKVMAHLGKFASPIDGLWRKLQLQFRIYVGKIERLWHHEERKKKVAHVNVEEQDTKIHSLLNDGQTEIQHGNLDKAEGLFIAAIKLDPRSYDAYRGLADTYFAKESFEEALETYQFLLQLYPNDDAVLVKIAELAEQQGDIEKAIEYYQQAVVINDSLSPRFYHLAELLAKIGQPEIAREAITSAVELEPKNPKYLDLLIEIGILCGDKDLATQGYKELRLVNPKNQKLLVFNDRIKELA